MISPGSSWGTSVPRYQGGPRFPGSTTGLKESDTFRAAQKSGLSVQAGRGAVQERARHPSADPFLSCLVLAGRCVNGVLSPGH